MSSYKLIYFNAKGRGEIIRYIFAQAGVKYEDNRVTKEEWPELKPNTPYGVLPILEVDGKQLAGGLVIAQYLAQLKEFDLAGSNEFENAEIAGIVAFIEDFVKEVIKLHFENDPTRKADLVKNFKESVVPKYLGKLNQLAKDNGGYLWKAKRTWADLYVATVLAMLSGRDKEFSDALEKHFPDLLKLHNTVESLPNIAKWIKERPVTEM